MVKAMSQLSKRGPVRFFRVAVLLAVTAGKYAWTQSDGGGGFLREVADVPLPGPAVRFDYQSLDSKNGRLYLAHMNADQLVVFDVEKRQVIANLDGFKRIHGVIAVPEIERVFASATGDHEMKAVDMATLKILGAAGPIDYPDGLAYAPAVERVFVSDEHGGVDAVVDAKTSKLVKEIPLGGGAGNTIYDAGSGKILVAVHKTNELVAIDPEAMKIVGRYKLAGVENPHGIALDLRNRLAFIAGEENHSLAVLDLRTMTEISVHTVGDDPDVLAFDPGLQLLYVSAESGVVTVFRETSRDVQQVSQFTLPHAHTVAVDSRTHMVYLPLENVEGHPLLRILRPTE